MSRRKARETAMKALFQMDQVGAELKAAIDFVVEENPLSETSLDYAWRIAAGAWRERKRIDQMIQKCSSEWKVSRMATVDRNILRLSIYEMLFLGDVPKQVVIDEAVEMAKKYGGEESGRFVNGILGSLIGGEPPGAVDSGD